ncbi:MAG: methyltransferase domain-containing protein [Candidatus Gracilibacteria bacterium]|nr:methyltransferase domain-containing protein [Candidatus Gracilibacteria bacterium]
MDRLARKNKNQFDIITLLDVLEHVPKNETISFLRELKGSLKTNGTLIIQIPNLQAPDGQLHRYNDFTNEFGYIEHSLQEVLIRLTRTITANLNPSILNCSILYYQEGLNIINKPI